MKVGVGKYKAESVEMLLLKHPDYVKWVLDRTLVSGPLAAVRKEIDRLITIFDTKPFGKTCSGDGCSKPATQASVYHDNLRQVWWCKDCDPYQLGADPGKLQTIRTYREALQHVECHCESRKADYSSLIRDLARAKGLPTRVREQDAVAFFQGGSGDTDGLAKSRRC